jgi:hypothetical protein
MKQKILPFKPRLSPKASQPKVTTETKAEAPKNLPPDEFAQAIRKVFTPEEIAAIKEELDRD